MKIVVNPSFGGFRLTDSMVRALNAKSPWDYRNYTMRADPKLVELVEKENPNNVYFDYLCVATIPDESTDWLITEYDGAEDLYFVLDGKIHFVDPDCYLPQEQEDEE